MSSLAPLQKKAIVLTATGVHLGFLGSYGNDWVSTPALDRLAADGVVFDQHFADRPDSEGARRAWRTGQHRFPALEDGISSAETADLIDILKRERIVTSLVTTRDPSGLFAAGWNRVRGAGGSKSFTPEDLLEAVGAALDELAPASSWLLWIDLGSLLPPWKPPQEFLEPYFEDEEEDSPLLAPAPGCVDPKDDPLLRRLRNTYAGVITYFDAAIEHLLEDLERRRLAEATLFFTSDRGLALGEHGVVGDYRPWLHEELIHVPLVVRLPDGVEAGRRVSALTQAVDLMPTLLDLFGIRSASVDGQSLAPLWRGEKTEVREYACAGLRIGAAVEWAMRTPEWAFILPLRQEPGDPPRNQQLYVKPGDRWEVNNVLQHHMERAEDLEQKLRRFVAGAKRED